MRNDQARNPARLGMAVYERVRNVAFVRERRRHYGFRKLQNRIGDRGQSGSGSGR